MRVQSRAHGVIFAAQAGVAVHLPSCPATFSIVGNYTCSNSIELLEEC